MLLKAAVLSGPNPSGIAAGFGRAAAIGGLSVPQRWLDDTEGDSVADDRYRPGSDSLSVWSMPPGRGLVAGRSARGVSETRGSD